MRRAVASGLLWLSCWAGVATQASEGHATGHDRGGSAPLARVWALFGARCGGGTCGPEVMRELASSLQFALGEIGADDLLALLDLCESLAAASEQLEATCRKGALRIVDGELKVLVGARRWGDALRWSGAHGQLGAAWETGAVTTVGRALEAHVKGLKAPQGLTQAVAIAEALTPFVAEAGAELAVLRAWSAVRTRVGVLAEAVVSGHLQGHAWAEAEAVVEAHAAFAPPDWRRRVEGVIASARAGSTELVADCVRAKTWEACDAAFDALVEACDREDATCNQAAKTALRQVLAPLFTRPAADAERLAAMADAVRGLDRLAAGDALAQLGGQALGAARQKVEAATRRLAREGRFEGAREQVDAFAEDFGEAWVVRMEAEIAAEDGRQTRIAERAAFPHCTRGERSLCCAEAGGPDELSGYCVFAAAVEKRYGGSAVTCVEEEAANFGCIVR